MKKLYMTPSSTAFDVQTEGVIASSVISNNGSVTPGDGEYNGEFLSNRGGWNSEDWNNAE